MDKNGLSHMLSMRYTLSTKTQMAASKWFGKDEPDTQ